MLHRLIEAGTGFASAGAMAVPLFIGAEGDWELDWPAIKFAYEPPTSIHNLSDSELKVFPESYCLSTVSVKEALN